MPNQKESQNAIPRKDMDRPSPDVEGDASDGQSDMRGKGAGDEQAQQPHSDHGAVQDKPMAGGALNFDDDDMVHPRGKIAGRGGTRQAQGGDSGKLGPPAEILSDRNEPSDPASRRK